MGQDLKGNFGQVAGDAPWNQDPLYVQAAEGHRQELDAAMTSVESTTNGFEHIHAYGQPVMESITRFCGKCDDLRNRKGGVNADALAKEFKDVEQRMDLHVLGAREILRRYDEVYVPDVVRECSVSDNPQDTRYLSIVQKRQQDFADRLTVLQGAQAAMQKAWEPFSGDAEIQYAVPVLKKIVLKKPSGS